MELEFEEVDTKLYAIEDDTEKKDEVVYEEGYDIIDIDDNMGRVEVIMEANENAIKHEIICNDLCTFDDVEKYYKILEYRKNYYQENYKYKQYFCGVCRCVMRQGSKSNHNKSFKHMSAVRCLYDNK